MSFAEGFVKLVGYTAAYTIAAPFDGLVRGLNGYNSPLDFNELTRKYPRVADSRLTTKGKNYRKWGPDEPIQFSNVYIVGDIPAHFGLGLTSTIGGMSALFPWLIGRGLREGYEFTIGNRLKDGKANARK